jgi:hypothetical protein
MSEPRSNLYPLPAENLFCVPPGACTDIDILFIGSGIALGSLPYLYRQAAAAGLRLNVVVLDAGPLDLQTHLAHTGWPRQPFLHRASMERVGGKLSLWGMSTPRPPLDYLLRWPYPSAELQRHFAEVEADLGVPEPIPAAGRSLETTLLAELRARFPDRTIGVAPLAIDGTGKRWNALTDLPRLTREDGLKLVARFRVTELVREGEQIAVRGRWLDGRTYTFRPRFVVVATGVEPSLPLIHSIAREPLPLQVADHLRIDMHGKLPVGPIARSDLQALGVAVLIMECRARRTGIPYHLEVKVAPRYFWRKGYMQSADNLRGGDPDETIYVQVQAVCAMHDRLPAGDLLTYEGSLPPVCSARDALFGGEVIEEMLKVTTLLGLEAPQVNPRPLLQNHHLIGAFRIGGAVDETFRYREADNLYILPPAAYPDADDDANPTLKSLVLTRFALDAILARRGGHLESNGRVVSLFVI